MAFLKWWIDKDGSARLCEHGTSAIPDDMHLGGAMELWGMTTDEALDAGMARVVLEGRTLYCQSRHKLNHKQKRSLGRLAFDNRAECIIGK
jgi:hypothetical protein